MRRLMISLTIVLTAALMLPGCGKKKEAAKDGAKKVAAGAVADKAGAAAEGAKSLKDKVAEKLKAAKAAVAPAPADIELKAGDNVVAWLSVRSLTALFDASETIGGQIGMLPPGTSLRDGFYRDLTRTLADQGVTGHEWLDKAKPLHVLLQDDNPNDLTGGVAVLLPMTKKAAAEAALKNAKKGADARGHAALLSAVAPGQTEPKPGAPEVFVDFLGDYMFVATNDARFGKAKAFAERLMNVKPPALAYLGVSVTDAVKTRKAQVDALLGQFAMMEKAQAKGGAGTGEYAKMMRKWVTELTRIEVTVDGDSGYIRMGGRMHAAAGSDLAKQMAAGKGRDARPAAASMPGNAFLSVVSDMDPKAGLNQLEQSMKVMKDMFKLDPAKAAELSKDLAANAKLQTGQSAFAMYRDGPAAAGAVAWFGTRDPAATLKAITNVIGEIGLVLLEQEKAEKAAKGKALTKAEQAQFAVVERALKARKLEPVLTTYGPMAAEMGLKITANTNTDGGVTCEVLDVEMDWKKLAREGDSEAAMAQKFLGDRTAVALCSGKDKISAAAGPSALEQGRRSAIGKKGGLIDAPVYAAAAKRTEGAPSSFVYLNLGAALSSFKGIVPPLPVKFPADRPVTVHCGNRSSSYACTVGVPVQAVGAAITLGRGR